MKITQIGKKKILHDEKGRFMKGTCGRIPKKINLEITLDLCYFLGLILGDGHVCKKIPWLVSIGSKSKDFIKSLEPFFNQINLNLNFHQHKQTKCWYIQACSRIFCEWYHSIVNYDDLLNLLSDNEKKISFIRGYYEAEGCAYYQKGKKQRYLYLYISNKEIWQLRLIQFLLHEIGIKSKIYGPYDRVTSFGKTKEGFVTIRRKKYSKLFMDMIKPTYKLPK